MCEDSHPGAVTLTAQRKDLEQNLPLMHLKLCSRRVIHFQTLHLLILCTKVFDSENCGEGNFSSPHAGPCCYKKNLDSRIFHLDNKQLEPDWGDTYI